MNGDDNISPEERKAEQPVWQAMFDGEVIIMAALLFAVGWIIWADWQHHKAEKRIHQIEQRQ